MNGGKRMNVIADVKMFKKHIEIRNMARKYPSETVAMVAATLMSLINDMDLTVEEAKEFFDELIGEYAEHRKEDVIGG